MVICILANNVTLFFCIVNIKIWIYFSTAYYGELRISGGGKSGWLEFYNGSNWGGICTNRFGYDAGNVACKQLRHGQSSDVYTYS